ncbi:MAG: DUF72 domain-containing protein [Candidatus Omnitrophica bacterium]|nr:DUF72 domain-containing protein [Candidatus Omnitrophota bacterium]
MNLKIGCSGFPAGKEEYFNKFRIVELQDTFIELPGPAAAEKLRAEAPDDFEFTMKAWQVITHEAGFSGYDRMSKPIEENRKPGAGSFKPSKTVREAWKRTEEVADILGAKVVVFDCPDLFLPRKENFENMEGFFRQIKNKSRRYAWIPPKTWTAEEIKDISSAAGIVHCVDPFDNAALAGDIGYFRLRDKEGPGGRHTGLDMKKLRDFCEKRSSELGGAPLYVFFNNRPKLNDAMRFEWIAANTGPLKGIGTEFLSKLCHEIEAAEEDEKVQLLSREAEKIVNLILHTEYARIDIEIESQKLKKMCAELFPDKEYLYDMIYGQRFRRLWEQFREDGE